MENSGFLFIQSNILNVFLNQTLVVVQYTNYIVEHRNGIISTWFVTMTKSCWFTSIRSNQSRTTKDMVTTQ